MTSETLAELVAAKRGELGLSYRQAAERSQGLISHSRLAAIENGEDRGVSDALLRGISTALDLPISRVRKAAGAPPTDRPFTLPARANRLTPRERRLVLNLVDTLLAAREQR